VTCLHAQTGQQAAEVQLPSDTPLVAASFSSTLKPFYSTEENKEMMDIGIHSIIPLYPPGEENESIKVGSSRPAHFLGKNLEVYIDMSRFHLPEPPVSA
jgi:hypothetical protein